MIYRYQTTIYAIRHNVTNRVYVGRTENFQKRINQHMSNLRAHLHPVEDMQEDFDQYGEDYTITVLEEIWEGPRGEKEYEWMQKLQSHVRGIGYNYKDRYFCHDVKHQVVFNGKTVTLGELSRETGVPYSVLYTRVVTLGWDVENAVSKPIRRRRLSWKIRN